MGEVDAGRINEIWFSAIFAVANVFLLSFTQISTMFSNASFEALVNQSVASGQYVGLGNYNSKILFIGKEPAGDVGAELGHGSAQSWMEGHDYSRPFDLNGKNPTWQQYQKLYETIFDGYKKTNNNNEITFVENIFTTELSNLPAPNANAAQNQAGFKENLIKRKEFFKNNFIQNFSITIIFADDNRYIETYQGEVRELFKVPFEEKNFIEVGEKNKMWIHYGDTPKKLVIHTRQLTNGASNLLLQKIAETVKEFVKNNNIDIIVK